MERIREIIKTATFRQSGITFSATIVNGALGGVFYILAARFLGPSDFGILSVAITVLTLGASIGGLGVNTGLIRFVSKYIKTDKERAFRFLKISLKANTVIGIFFIVFGLLFSNIVAKVFLDKPNLTEPLKISFAGVGFLLLFGFVTRYLQAFQRFWTWGVLQVATNLLRVVVVITLFFLGWFSLYSGLWLYTLIPLVGFLYAFIFIIPKAFIFVKRENTVAKEFFHYNKWVAMFTIVTAFSSRIDTFVVARLVSAESLGLYAAASQLVYIVPQIVSSIGTVLAPKMASMGSIHDFFKFFKKTQFFVLGLAGLGIIAGPIVAYFVPLVFGPDYLASVPIFFVLLASALIFLVSVPLHNAVLYYFSSPKLLLWLGLGHLIITTFSSLFLVNIYGIFGAAFAVLLGSLFNLLVPAVWVGMRLRKELK